MPPVALVTGGAGFIGSHVCKALAQSGWQPVVFDNLSTGHRDLVRWGPLVEGDILDGGALDRAMTTHRPQAVLHFAGLSLVNDSMREPERYRHENVQGARTLLDAMLRHEVGAIVFSSTAAVYGAPPVVPIDEQAPTRPLSPYGTAKLAIEAELASSGLAWTALRYFNAAGADPDGEAGEHHDPETHLVPIVLDVALGRRNAVTVFGDDYNTPDGTCIRDYVHVCDLADAHLAALECLVASRVPGVVNLGTGAGTSVLEIIETAGRVSRRPIPVRRGARRVGDPPTLVCSNTKAEQVLGWRPRRGIEVQVEDAWRWHRQRFGG